MKRNTGLLAVICLVAGSTLFVAAPSRAGGGGGGCGDDGLTDARTTQVDMSDMCFRPTVARADVGDTVKFINKDTLLHAVGGISSAFGDLHGQIAPGRSVSYRFDEEGVFPYVCVFHPGMGGAIVVGDGEGKVSAAGVATFVPPAESDQEPAVEAQSESVPTGSRNADLVPFAVALGVALLVLALTKRRGVAPPV